ncbi:hypothetical protein NP511_02085 [Natrinema thermotolerans]|uniref:Uncharacterized protein n=1 Tax=Natrinema thermotolerans TaxID=121872 RepID=A0AAF0T157_9EURY|nr:hypothetical protein [Natrinema thermotolerans]WPH65850.1 hypothetical protein HJTV4_gp27 [Haloarchaeal virus HJTV-4]QCC60755.1 hypothetical protein DVR14_19780 [Natrinema thermotolerans]QCC61633.1 hypothetical protein DVR14_23910 [Natrinema thermotolerans]WMT07800.1 hypothetical protein NP511_20800 [Natrinema thermotolerans]WMT08432.1 hypothetical protein NP511_02085 [Natrinema thermotolerans]
MLSGFENDEAVFFVERQVGSEEGPYGETEPVYEWVPLSLEDDQWDYVDGEVVYDEADVEAAEIRSEQRSAEYIREVYSEWPQEVYRLYVDPVDVGSITGGNYELEIEADDRVDLASADGRFAAQPPNVQRLDSAVPEHVELEVTRVEV